MNQPEPLLAARQRPLRLSWLASSEPPPPKPQSRRQRRRRRRVLGAAAIALALLVVVVVLWQKRDNGVALFLTDNYGTVTSKQTSPRAPSFSFDADDENDTTPRSSRLPSIDDDNGFLYCRLDKLQDPQQQQQHPNKNKNNNPIHTMPIWYQCEGPAYTQFAHQLRTHVRQWQSSSAARAFAVPRPTTALPANTTVLVLGNSHLRQVALAWACQYAHQMQRLQRFDTQYSDDDPYMVTKITFTNHAVLWIVANSYVVYSPQWPRLLQGQLQGTTRLSTMDAVVLGVFNGCLGPVAQNTTFYQNMQKQHMKDDHVDCRRYPGPSLADVAQAVNNNDTPIVFVTPFSVSHLNESMQARRFINQQQQQYNNNSHHHLAFIKGRTHVDALGHECGAAVRWGVNRQANTSCVNHNHNAYTWHRCTGAAGGHADVVAWSVQDVLWQWWWGE